MGIIGAVVGGVIGAGSALLGNHALRGALPTGISLPDYTKAFSSFSSQGGSLADVGSLLAAGSDADNARYEKNLEQYFPGLLKAIQQQGETALAYQQGAISPDQQRRVAINEAEAAYRGGYQGAPMASDQHELGLVKAALANQAYGDQLSEKTHAEAASLSPFGIDVSSTLLTPQDLLKRSDNLAYFNNDLINQSKLAKAGSDIKLYNQLGSAVATGARGLAGYLTGPSAYATGTQGGGASVPGGWAGTSGNWFG